MQGCGMQGCGDAEGCWDAEMLGCWDAGMRAEGIGT